LAAGTDNRPPQYRHFTVLPRADSGTERIARHLRFGQTSRTTLSSLIAALLLLRAGEPALTGSIGEIG
jgi:hypothetical protein